MRAMTISLVVFACFLAGVVPAFVGAEVAKGQTIYVPAYSHVLTGDRGYRFNLAVTLVIRNTDARTAIAVTDVEYYDDNGKLVKKFVTAPVRVGPMGTIHYFLKESDETGGIGANFVVRWKADKEVNVPIIESVMIGARGGQGISFVSPGKEIQD